MQIKAYKNIDAYIKDYPKEVRPLLEDIRRTVKKAAPKAEEAMAYGLPTFKLHGNLVHFGAYKKHIGFYPAPSGILAFQKELRLYKKGKGTLQFPLDKPLPLKLIREIVLFRVKENTDKAEAKQKPKRK